ncbi:rhodanese-like domain-containing protein [Singulisphaera acidiphila]|uniref:Rhodanese-related sulfurtransferase n=1 Tax=Singulisphaera acidiphila (strain ATCC BAA-1392 / DSM 18658 / VKM B-2454 / MOB10) TaxID=886293 RepID=L0DLU8_SINAD|nr:rhodanese-like domain-containing protein [Singulisphaera acidiphila]AGA29795.1 Rhodanese-related sulfurtransferase [Singulisphaera acidiphila DSM 18658]
MPNPTSDIARMTAEELKQHFDRGEPLVILDVREPVERAFCAIPIPPTARDLHVPMGEIPARLEEIKVTKGESPLVVYCHLGVRSRQAASWLVHQGLAGLVNLEGGIDAWSTDVDPDLPRY